jgi:hypothetical protein
MTIHPRRGSSTVPAWIFMVVIAAVAIVALATGYAMID